MQTDLRNLDKKDSLKIQPKYMISTSSLTWMLRSGSYQPEYKFWQDPSIGYEVLSGIQNETTGNKPTVQDALIDNQHKCMKSLPYDFRQSIK